MHHEPGGLVDHGQVLVLEHEGEGDGGGLEGAGRLLIGEPDGDALAAGEEAGRAGRLSVDGHGLIGHQPRRLRARKPELVGEKAVEALRACDRDREGQLRQPRRTPVRGGGRLRARGRLRGRWRRSSRRCRPR